MEYSTLNLGVSEGAIRNPTRLRCSALALLLYIISSVMRAIYGFFGSLLEFWRLGFGGAVMDRPVTFVAKFADFGL